MAQYLSKPGLDGAATLIDLIDVDSQKWVDYAAKTSGLRKSLYQLEGRRVRALEEEVACTFDRLALTTEDEVECLRGFCPDAPVISVPNGVDFDFFHPNERIAPVAASCVFVGAMDYKPNIDGVTWFCESVWPDVVRERPEAVFTIVGRRPVEAIRRLARHTGVRVVADVADVRPYLWEASVALAPLRVARGVQNKVLEAMAAGTPTLVSPEALTGLRAVDGEHVVVARAAEQWRATLMDLFDNEPLRQRLARAARRYVTQNHRWENCLTPVADILCNATAQFASRSIT